MSQFKIAIKNVGFTAHNFKCFVLYLLSRCAQIHQRSTTVHKYCGLALEGQLLPLEHRI